jgi:hypothetical protein
MTWAEHLLSFFRNLQPPQSLPAGVELLYPQKEPQVMQIVEQFLHRFYEDQEPRRIFLGINPGRFGAGVTGVNFTAPRQLKEFCGIDHPFKPQTELSAEFIYQMIDAYGGVDAFYKKFFIGSVCPLGFIKSGKNINYYDDPELIRSVEPFIIKNMDALLSYRYNKTICYCIGGEKNFKYLRMLNDQYQWFQQIEALPHPRFIMQYKRKQLDEYIQQYIRAISK